MDGEAGRQCIDQRLVELAAGPSLQGVAIGGNDDGMNPPLRQVPRKPDGPVHTDGRHRRKIERDHQERGRRAVRVSRQRRPVLILPPSRRY